MIERVYINLYCIKGLFLLLILGLKEAVLTEEVSFALRDLEHNFYLLI